MVLIYTDSPDEKKQHAFMPATIVDPDSYSPELLQSLMHLHEAQVDAEIEDLLKEAGMTWANVTRTEVRDWRESLVPVDADEQEGSDAAVG